MEKNKIYCGDCIELMQQIEEKSIDLILCDLPYGVTQNRADIIIPLDNLWEQYKRVIKERGNILLTSQYPFTIDLINYNREWFRYDLVWDKKLSSGFLNANRMPLRIHEHILVFYNKIGTYNPQFTEGKASHSKGRMVTDVNRNYGNYGKVDNKDIHGNKKFPVSIISFQKPHASKALHPTEKPVGLFEYLIRTYSNEGDLVLDNCIGIGTTAVACRRSNRHFIGIDTNLYYVEIVNKRLAQTTLNGGGANSSHT